MSTQKTSLKSMVINRLPQLVRPVKKLASAKKYFDIKRVILSKKSLNRQPKPKKSTPAKKVIAAARPKITKEDLINAESAIGGQLFGPIPRGHRREFFLYRHNYWIFHESWQENGKHKESTITYEVRKNGIYKNPLGSGYRKITGAEAKNFCLAVKEYQKLVKAKLYVV